MNITVDTNAAQVGGIMRRLFADQIPFATSKAINETTKEVQTAQRAHQRDVFNVRREQFIDRSVKITQFAKKTAPEARIAIRTPGPKDRSYILTKFESDRVRLPFRGSRLAIPVDVPRTGAGVVQRKYWPKALEFDSKGRVARGKHRTFSIMNKAGGGGAIFQRRGRRGADTVRTLFLIVPKATIEPVLQFEATAIEVVKVVFPRNFDEAFARAVASAR